MQLTFAREDCLQILPKFLEKKKLNLEKEGRGINMN